MGAPDVNNWTVPKISLWLQFEFVTKIADIQNGLTFRSAGNSCFILRGLVKEPIKEEDEQRNLEDQIWLDETLSDDELRIQQSLVDTWWYDVRGRKNLTPDERVAQPFVSDYLLARMEILAGLRLSFLEGTKAKEDPKRLSDRRALKIKILKLVAIDDFTDWLKAFGIGEDHRLSPANLFSKGTVQRNDGSSLAGSGAARSMPHYISPWKNAILLSLLAKGSDADCSIHADYLDTYFPFVERPEYCRRIKEPISFLVASVATKGGKRTPRHPEIRLAFQKDLGKVRADLALFLPNSLVGEPEP